MDDNDQEARNGLSRRSLIKRSVVVGGLVWASPVMSTVASAQTAGSVPPTSGTTAPPQCDCNFCATVTSGSTTLYFDCVGATTADCDCLCKCGGVNRPCGATDPCNVDIVCTPRPTPC